MANLVPPSGPIPARIMIVGEAPGAEEERTGKPFVGASGAELDRMLGEAGISRSECFVTNVCRVRPPGNDINHYFAKAKKDRTNEHINIKGRYCLSPVDSGIKLLSTEIEMVKPNVIIALGNTALWALTGRIGIGKWRGSMLTTDGDLPSRPGASESGTILPYKVIPTLHPAAILRQWSDRAIAVSDLRRAARFKDGAPYPTPQYKFILRPTYDSVLAYLNKLLDRLQSGERIRLSFDIETRQGHVACVGISVSRTDGICIPFMCVERRTGYWKPEEEAAIVWLLRSVLTHANSLVVGQNLLYDAQYTWRHWRFVPNVVQDTMISQHAVFSDMSKSLAFLASMYCDYYVYWKDEGKNWDPKVGEDQLWHYNLLDCVYTLEVAEVLEKTVDKLGLRDVHNFQQSMFWPVLETMIRGVLVDTQRRSKLTLEVADELEFREEFLRDSLGHDFNPRSPKQMQALFYNDFGLPVQMTRAAKGVPARPTLNDDALTKLAKIEPLVKPIINCISDIRTLGVFLGNFLTARLDTDSRMRCAYNIGGSISGASAPKTYRLSSSENAFGSGGNLQNIPSSKSKSVGKAAARGSIEFLGNPLSLPDLRSMFIPDSGKVWIDGDLDRADLQVVVWETDDEMLKVALRMGVDMHLMNAFVLEGRDPPPLDELVESHPKYPDHRGPKKHEREFAKVWVHGTNYGGQPPTMARNTGRTIAECARAQRIWFGAHPGIEKWHRRVEEQIRRKRYIDNRFGYRWYIFDRIDSILPEAIAWVPQSTVSIVINRIWMNLFQNVPEAEVLLQVHDSLCLQVRQSVLSSVIPKIKEAAQVVIPYDDPLIIPFGLKMSATSWGECK